MWRDSVKKRAVLCVRAIDVLVGMSVTHGITRTASPSFSSVAPMTTTRSPGCEAGGHGDEVALHAAERDCARAHDLAARRRRPTTKTAY